MKHISLGSLEISVIGLGCNNFGRALDQVGTNAVVSSALDAGINFFDTASNYGEGHSEEMLGKAIGAHRDEVVLATKFGMDVHGVEGLQGAHPDTVRRSVERSLRQLGTDRVDLLQLHFPDPDVPIHDTLVVLGELVNDGVVLEIGCSNLDAAQLAEALAASHAAGLPRFVSNQIEYSMVVREPETNGLAELGEAEGVALLPFYPLASGLLTGKKRKGVAVEGRLNMDRYQRFLTDENFEIVERLRSFAEQRSISMVTVALGWLLAQPTVPSITPGATSPEQIVGNVAAAEWSPSEDELLELGELIQPPPMSTL